VNITQVVARFPPAIGGMEEHVYQISLELSRRGHKLSVITSNEIDGRASAVQEENMHGIHVYRHPLFMPKVMREYWLIPGVFKSLKKTEADVFHVHGYRCLSSFTAISLAHFKHTPILFTPHGIYPPKSFSNTLIKLSFDRTLGRLMLCSADRTIALSEHNRRLLLQMGASADKIVIVPNGVNVETYRNLQRNAKVLKELDSQGPILIYVGRLDWNKRVEKIVESMPKILKNFPSAKLVVIGPDYANCSVALLDLGRKLGVERSLVMTGKVSAERLLELYSVADVFIMPSSYEGFGLSMLEAMICRIPVIVSPAGGPGDILSHGVNSWFLEHATPEEISESVLSVLANRQLREKIVKNAFELIKARYTWEKVVDELEKNYTELTKKN
jgi:glycosyltransferase involved in cell wall biosynthesis